MLDYAVVTPAHDERENLKRLAGCMVAQTHRPSTWVIVDDGSADGTPDVVSTIRLDQPWIRLVLVPPAQGMARGGPVVRSFTAGLETIDALPAVVVKLDADVSFGDDYFERLLRAFDEDPCLGMASGSAVELEGGAWRQRFSTGTSVWGASRAYRREVLPVVLPLEQRMGWDAVDEHKAQLAGWSTRTLVDLPFRHHRPEGERDRSRTRVWRAQGSVAHYLGYRPSYLVARALFQTRHDPAALAMIAAFAEATLRREPRCPDARVRERVRGQQRLRLLRRRAREKLGRL